MEPPITPARYLRRRPVDVATALALTGSLGAAFTPALGDGAREALDIVRQRAEALATAWKAQQSRVVTDRRPAYQALAAAWGAMVGRAQHYTALPVARFPRQAAACRLVALLAQDGLAVLHGSFACVWSALKARLELVREAGLDDDLRAIVGEEFVVEVAHCHAELGAALGIVAAQPARTKVNVLQRLREHGRAVTDYVVQVLATVRRHDAETAQRALAALKPLDELRDAARRTATR